MSKNVVRYLRQKTSIDSDKSPRYNIILTVKQQRYTMLNAKNSVLTNVDKSVKFGVHILPTGHKCTDQ